MLTNKYFCSIVKQTNRGFCYERKKKQIAGIIDADEEQAKKFEISKEKNKAPIDIECE